MNNVKAIKQSTNTVFLVRPSNFGYNELTAKTNSFQKITNLSNSQISENVLTEFDQLIAQLISCGIHVFVFNDNISPVKPDAVFPNNWISLHEDGTLILYPMESENRRTERDPAIIKKIKNLFKIQEIVDFSNNESQKSYLEGTGSIVFDHLNKYAYACISPRTDLQLLKHVCHILDYTPVTFYAYDRQDKLIYHTNVMMHVGSEYAIICLDSIKNKIERSEVLQNLLSTGRKVIPISMDQTELFAGNMLELCNDLEEKFTFMSKTAYHSLTQKQVQDLSEYTTIVSVSIPTIESIGGGSVRCMIAEIFAQPN